MPAKSADGIELHFIKALAKNFLYVLWSYKKVFKLMDKTSKHTQN